MKVLASTWFTEMGSTKPIGIVIVDTGYEYKAYIGTAEGNNQQLDELTIAQKGAKFPITYALSIIGVSIDILKR